MLGTAIQARSVGLLRKCLVCYTVGNELAFMANISSKANSLEKIRKFLSHSMLKQTRSTPLNHTKIALSLQNVVRSTQREGFKGLI